MRRWGPTVLLLTFLALPAAGQAEDADEAFRSLAMEFLDDLFAYNPVFATSIGDHRHDGEIDDMSPQGVAVWAGKLRDYRSRLRRVARSQLSPENQIDADLMGENLEAMLFHLTDLREHVWNPLLYNRLMGGGLFPLLFREFAPWPDRLASVLGRLEAIPRVTREAMENLTNAPRIHVETAIQQNQGTISLIENDLAPRFSEAPELVGRLRGAAAAAVMALQAYGNWLEEDLLPRADLDFRLGEVRYDRKLRFALATDLSPGEVLRRAEEEYERVREEMYDVARTIYETRHPYTEFPDEPDDAYRSAIIRAALEEAAIQQVEPGGMLEAAAAAVEEATRFVREKGLISLPDEPLEIIEMPEFMRGVAVAYCDAPGPLDRSQKTYYMVSPIPEDWPPEHVESFLREYNSYSLRELTIHEAMPGHYVQLAHANRFPSVLRAVFSSGTFVEGWAMYSEKVMIDAGYLGDDPRMRLVHLKWYLRSIVNAILDQKIHTAGMTEDEALRLMIEGAFQEEREAAGKWRRACLTSAQLSTYFVGFQEHLDMRRDMEDRLGAEFHLGDYHEILLAHGSPPMKFLRRLLTP